MIAKGVPAGTILQLTVTLLPQALALTIPMALLIGLLVGLGRLSADREFVVMMACGISPYRLLHPILVFAVVCWGLTSWVMLKAMPDGNQRFREISTEIAMNRAEGEVRPRVFFEDFPNIVLYVREIPTNGQGWLDVLAADTSNPSTPVIFLAKRGRMVVDRQARTIQMVLEEGTRHSTKLEDPTGLRGAEVRADDRVAQSRERVPAHRPGARRARAARRGAAGARRRTAGAGHLAAPADHGDPQEVLRADRVLRVRGARPRARRQQPQGRQAGRLRARHRA